jgi:hypothetical protein
MLKVFERARENSKQALIFSKSFPADAPTYLSKRANSLLPNAQNKPKPNQK